MRKSKFLLLCLLTFFCTIGFSISGSAAADTFTMPLTALNQVRGADQIIIYTYDHRTADNKSGANQYGYEISVDAEGYVVQVGTNVTFATDGYIISVHGTDNVKSAQDNVSVGDSVTYDENTKLITFTFSVLGSITNAEKQITELKNLKIELDLGAYDVDIKALNDDIEEFEKEYADLQTLCNEVKDMPNSDEKTAKEAQVKQEYDALMAKIETSMLKTIISLKVESRGVWHRPNVYDGEKTVEGITKTLDELKSAGINQVFLETLWWGHTIGTSEFMDSHPRVSDGNYGDYKDYLSAFIDIAHKKGIEVHAWTETFFASNDNAKNHYPQWLRSHPEWLNLTYDGGYKQTGKGTEETFIFTDPANEEVRNFMTNVYKELVENYDFDGIQFDYIRYPDERSLELSSGYTEAAMTAFKEENNIDLSKDLKKLLADEKAAGQDTLYLQWKEWRAAQVTKFVQDTVTEIRKIDKDINFSIAVGADFAGAKSNLMQDWKTWVENGWIDIIAPMAYTYDVEWVKQVVKDMNKISNGLTYNYTGIGAFMKGTPLLYSDQILASRDLHGLGSVIFASQNVLQQDEMKAILSQGLNKHEAITPNAELSKLINTVFDYILDKSDRIYIPKELMNADQKESLKTELDNIREMPMNNADDYYKIYQKLDTLIFDMNSYVNSVGAQRIKEDLFSLSDLIDLKISRYLINYGFWDPATTPERPATDTFEYPVIEPEKDSNALPYIIGGVVLAGAIATTTVVMIRRKA